MQSSGGCSACCGRSFKCVAGDVLSDLLQFRDHARHCDGAQFHVVRQWFLVGGSVPEMPRVEADNPTRTRKPAIKAGRPGARTSQQRGRRGRGNRADCIGLIFFGEMRRGGGVYDFKLGGDARMPRLGLQPKLSFVTLQDEEYGARK